MNDLGSKLGCSRRLGEGVQIEGAPGGGWRKIQLGLQTSVRGDRPTGNPLEKKALVLRLKPAVKLLVTLLKDVRVELQHLDEIEG